MSDAQQDGKEVPREPQLIRRSDGTPYEVPVEGSLSLLALGYRGLMAWRAKRAQVKQERNASRP